MRRRKKKLRGGRESDRRGLSCGAFTAAVDVGLLPDGWHNTLNNFHKMNLRCQHCGERIVARSFGKCPGCYRDLPEDLQLSPKEKELEEMEEMWRKAECRSLSGGGGDGGGSSSV